MRTLWRTTRGSTRMTWRALQGFCVSIGQHHVYRGACGWHGVQLGDRTACLLQATMLQPAKKY